MRPTSLATNAPRTAWTWAVLLLGLLALLGPARAGAEDSKDEGKKGDPAPAADAPARKPILPDVEADAKVFKPLVDAARQYFDLDEEQWKGRKAFVDELEKQVDEGRWFLKDMDALRWLVYEGRSFEPQLTNRKWQKTWGVSESKNLGGTLEYIRSEDMVITFSVPKDYWSEKDLRGKYPRPAPNPLLLTMHDKRDFNGQKYPGKVLLDRRYPRKEWDEFYDKWIVLCPVVAAGNYLTKEGMIRSDALRNPFAEFWRHYHIDYDRIVIDGSEQAFAAATSMPVFFAGIVFQHGDDGRWKLKEGQPEQVRNFAAVPVYVVDNPELAQQLRDAGHPDVTAGVGGKTLQKWLDERKRKAPRKFEWVADQFDQVLAYWVNLDSPIWGPNKRELKVDVDEKENVIRIGAVGINDLSLFLNDDIVDLDRKVRIEINGHVQHDEMIKPVEKSMEKVGRDFDFLFNRDPVRIRTSMFFGWLTPARVVRLEVREPRPKEEPKAPKAEPAKPAATEEQEAQAARLFNNAKIYHERGNDERAIELLDKVLELPENRCSAKARELKETIGKAEMPK